jgi:hypothetical protein
MGSPLKLFQHANDTDNYVFVFVMSNVPQTTKKINSKISYFNSPGGGWSVEQPGCLQGACIISPAIKSMRGRVPGDTIIIIPLSGLVKVYPKIQYCLRQ